MPELPDDLEPPLEAIEELEDLPEEEIVDPTEDVKLVNVLKLTRDDLNEIGSEIGDNAGSGGFAFPGMGCKSVPASTTAPCTEAPETKAYDSGD